MRAGKANQPALLWDLERAFEDARLVAETGTRARTVDLGHGRIAARACRATTARAGDTAWPGPARAARIERTRVAKASGAVARATAYLVTSLPPARADAAAPPRLNRGPWGIEHRAHGVRDATVGEDRSRVRRGAAPQALAAIRNLAPALLRAHGRHAIKAAREHLAGHPAHALALLGPPRQ